MARTYGLVLPRRMRRGGMRNGMNGADGLQLAFKDAIETVDSLLSKLAGHEENPFEPLKQRLKECDRTMHIADACTKPPGIKEITLHFYTAVYKYQDKHDHRTEAPRIIDWYA